MGFFCIESKNEKQDKLNREKEKLERERIQKEREKAIDKVPLFFTHALDFKYKILCGCVYAWCHSDGFNKALETVHLELKKHAYEYNADCLIDVKYNISYAMGGSPAIKREYIVHATGIAVKKMKD